MTDIDIILGDTKLQADIVTRVINNLLDADYRTSDDYATGRKVAVLRHLVSRNQLLEQTLSDTYRVLGELGKVL